MNLSHLMTENKQDSKNSYISSHKINDTNTDINYHEIISEYTQTKKTKKGSKYVSKPKIKLFLERLFGITHNLSSNIFSRDASDKNRLL